MTNRPLEGLKVLEFAGIGPGPFCGMMLADMGADVVRIDRPETVPKGVGPVTGRGRRSIALNLKTDQGRTTALALIKKADALFEGFRPGVMERMGLGPEVAQALNPRLVYGRMTGWGQWGPLAKSAGHDVNYVAISGALGAMGRPGEPPAPPLNLVGDYGGGAMFLLAGMLAGLLQARTTGQGMVIDAAMSDGSALLMAMFHDLQSLGLWQDKRGGNLLDGSAPFYDTYECADGEFVSIGSIEPQFYAELLSLTGLDTDAKFANQYDFANWPSMKEAVAAVIVQKTRKEWIAALEGTDVCFAPVLSLAEAKRHPHNAARETFVSYDGIVQPAAAPRFGGVSHYPTRKAPKPGEHSEEILNSWGVRQDLAAE
ncbi:CoA transferase [Tropicibacter sp. R16_0]|nr:CoA transferase [Tropicibacter sp. R16_0]